MLSCKFGMTKILMVASEARPFAMTGGLGDVIGSLPAALHAIGENVAILLPADADLRAGFLDMPAIRQVIAEAATS